MQADERMKNLAAWLTAVWDEEERLARDAAYRERGLTGVWFKPSDGRSAAIRDSSDGVVVYDEGSPTEQEIAHIIAHDPASVLARIAADRKILALHRHVTDPAGWIDCIACGEQGRAPGDVAYAFCEHVRLLASPYADRPGFRSEWLVERQGVEHR